MTQPEIKRQDTTLGQVGGWAGPAIFSYGYRPFFLMAGLWAALAMVFWIFMLAGQLTVWSYFDAVTWHAHEMLFGYLGAVLAGFLLTAVPNWTGRAPIIGWPLAGLAALWLAGRVVVAFSAALPPVVTGLLDLAFPVGLALVIGREIFIAGNWRNLIIVAFLGFFALANALFHISAAADGYAVDSVGFRLGLATSVMLISVIGGRVVPSFTRNWLVKQGRESQMVTFGPFDKIALMVTAICLTLWVALPQHPATAVICAIAAGAQIARLGRWSGWHARSEPLLWILHVAYLFVPLGFLAIAVSIWREALSPEIGALHIWMAGAIGVTTLAMMTRASLGHAGRPLTATRGITAVYLLVIASVAFRIIAAYDSSPAFLLDASAGAWVGGFAGFCVIFWPILTKQRT